MKLFLVLSCLLIIYTIGCNNNCKKTNGKDVAFELFSYSKGDKYNLVLDDGKFTWESPKLKRDFATDFNRKCFIITSYCTSNDSIKVRFNYNNSLDTTFFLNSNIVSTCYLNVDINFHFFHVYYIYKDSLNIVDYD